MLSKRLVSLSIVSASLAAGLVSSTAFAQGKDAKDPKAAKPDATVDEGEKKEEAASAAPKQGPVEAGPPSQAMAAARRQFNKKNWLAAARGLYRVFAGESGDDAGNKQLAQYYLAISLYRLKFYSSSYLYFKLIAANKYHLKFKETLLWLAKLTTQLPEPAGIVSVVGKYGEGEVKQFDNENQRDLYWQLNFMLGRFKYDNKQYAEAVRLFQRVGKKSKFYVRAQFFTGISHVQLRKSVPAVKSFQRVEKAVAEGAKVEDPARMRDLAYLSMARTYYSASIRLNPETNAPSVNAKKLSAAVKYWNLVDEGSEYWLDGLFEQSWAYFMAGQYPRALGNIHTIQSPYFPNSFYPETDVLKAMIYFTNCNYKAAEIVVARFMMKYTPIRDALEKKLAKYQGADSESKFYKFFLKVKDGEASLDAKIKPIVENALGDRQLLRHVEYVKVLDEEIARFQKAPKDFQNSKLGAQVKGVLKIFRKKEVDKAGGLAKSRYERVLAELKERLRDGDKINIDITAAKRARINKALAQKVAKYKGARVSAEDAKIFGVVKPDEEHILWPFDGEYWRDELGFYRQVVESSCGR